MHSRPTGHLVKAFRREVQSLDENLPVYDVRSLEDRIALNRLEVSLFRIWPISSPKPAMSRWLPICFPHGHQPRAARPIFRRADEANGGEWHAVCDGLLLAWKPGLLFRDGPRGSGG